LKTSESDESEKPARKMQILIAQMSTSFNQVLIQIASVPLFIHYFSYRDYAIWLIAFNIAQFSSILDLGTLTSSQNAFQLLGQQARNAEIRRRVFEVNLILAVTFLVYFIASVIFISNSEVHTSFALIAILLFSNYIQSLIGIYEGLTRVQRLFTKGILTSNLLRFCEFIGLSLGIVLFSPNLVYAALTSLVIKSIVFVVIWKTNAATNTFISFGKFHFTDFVSLISEGFPFLLSKMADWIFISGTIIVLSKHFSDSEIVYFVLIRTFFRQGIQIAILFGSAFVYSTADAWAKRDNRKMKIIVWQITKVQALTVTGSSVAYLVVGNFFFLKWTSGEFSLTSEITTIGVIYSLFLVINQSIRTFYSSINLNRVVSRVSFAFAAMQLLALSSDSLIRDSEMAFIALASTEFLILIVTWLFSRGHMQTFSPSRGF
jgi:O-antigen/teichoic acid export membrane protein